MAPHQERVVTEKADLDEKLGKLLAFFQTPIFAGRRKQSAPACAIKRGSWMDIRQCSASASRPLPDNTAPRALVTPYNARPSRWALSLPPDRL